jgi:hypothetical protein
MSVEDRGTPLPAAAAGSAGREDAGGAAAATTTAGATATRTAGTAAGRCSGLRWKGMFIDSPPDPTIPNPHDGFVWCRHTLTCLGPDGGVVEEASCRPGRGCYEEP